MSERAVSTIAEQLSTNLFNRLTNGPRWGTVDDFKAVLNEEARNILAALKAARIAVVELKTEPDDAEVDAQEWATSSALCARHFEDSPGLIYVWDKAHAWDHGADPITPTQARELAAALLTAAAAVGARITVEEQP